ncbi:hypothetical protein IQ272_09690 [Chroococcidiopsidales cyanobacterium LEGE 13417]|uniref:hypothetical protein n=1 Tax=Chroococcidiopsis sp. CCALA 051 TaxID=869949 RepID=UPI001304C0F7|nr:hypothetical protein [Chroococcidiopsis sp. CCALA 051]MBE9016406.1 hypothetical protein [Chroococcidiopsidales cyanobacterium LEGE 13417]
MILNTSILEESRRGGFLQNIYETTQNWANKPARTGVGNERRSHFYISANFERQNL